MALGNGQPRATRTGYAETFKDYRSFSLGLSQCSALFFAVLSCE